MGKADVAILIVTLIAIIPTLVLGWNTIQAWFSDVGRFITAPFRIWKTKKAEKAYMEYIEQHKEELIHEVMESMHQNYFGMQVSKNAKVESIEFERKSETGGEKWKNQTMRRFMRKM